MHDTLISRPYCNGQHQKLESTQMSSNLRQRYRVNNSKVAKIFSRCRHLLDNFNVSLEISTMHADLLCALILLETSALYKLFTYLLT